MNIENVSKMLKINFDAIFSLCANGLEIDIIQDFLMKHHKEFNGDSRDEMRLSKTCNFVLNLFFEHGINIIPDDKVKETSPKRKKIRDDVRKNTKEAADKMATQYNKRLKIKVREFAVGDKVTIKIPEVDRHKTDPRRLPAVIIKVCGSKLKTYELQCVAGIIMQKYTANDLEPFHGLILHPLPDMKVTLRSAAIFSRPPGTSTPMSCSCKKGCQTNRCKCRVNKTSCTSRCHSGKVCLNVDVGKSEESWLFPKHGGVLDGITFSNTCPIDNWIMIFHTMHRDYDEQYFAFLMAFENPIWSIIENCKRNFMKAKMGFAHLNNLPLRDGVYDFYGLEIDLVINHLKCGLSSYREISHCTNPRCPDVRTITDEAGYPSISYMCSSKVAFSDEITGWLQNKWFGDCRKKYNMSLPLPDNSCIYWDSNSMSGNLAYCNGRRTYAEKIFVDIPPYILVNVEAVQYKYVHIIPDEIILRDGKRYRLIGVTFHRYGKAMSNHYTLMLRRRDGEKQYYDGWNVKPLENSPISSKPQTLQHCMYVLMPQQ